MINRLPLVLALGFAATACVEADEPLSKEEVRSFGKADSPIDYCELYDWYGDGICDDFCPFPDPDCDVPESECEAAAGTCITGYVTSCPAANQQPSSLSCGDHPIAMTCCAPDETCPDVCGEICAGEPEPDLPDGCPVPLCSC